MTLSQPTSALDLQSKTSSLRDRMQKAQKAALLGPVRDKAGELDAAASGMLRLAHDLRERGYAWERDLEARCIDLRDRWAGIRPGVFSAMERETEALRSRVADAEWRFNGALAQATDYESALGPLSQADQAVAGLESAANAANDAIDNMFDPLGVEVRKLSTTLKSLLEQLKQAAGSSVAWRAGESLVRAVKARWDRDGKDDPKGWLYLSDQRLIFERDEEVATKKTLFVVTEKKRVQEIQIDEPVARMTELEASKRGLLKNEDHLDARFGAGARFPTVHFHIDGQDCKEWSLTLRRLQAGELEATRAVPISQADRDRLANAPRHCPTCHAPFEDPILRGQTAIKCAYCGTSTPF
ncbi:MAG: hypothetical protein K1X39_05095 [Thermoflexales bacterium]|nr:hypothetical protein [Thermoflexales bacterium]